MIEVKVTRRFAATPEQVFDAWLDPAQAGRFLFATPTGQMVRVEIDARVGGKFAIVERRGEQDAEHYGEFLEINRPRRLVFVYGVALYTQAVDRVIVSVEPIGPGCELVLVHEMDDAYAEYVEPAKRGWTGILDGLAAVVERRSSANG